MKNQRLPVQFYAPDDGRRVARNMLSFISIRNNKNVVTPLHLVGFFLMNCTMMHEKRAPKEIVTVTLEGTRTRGRPGKRRDEVEEVLNIMGTKKQEGKGQRPSGIGEDFLGRQGPQRVAAIEQEKWKNY
jgi:hypothetical protein